MIGLMMLAAAASRVQSYETGLSLLASCQKDAQICVSYVEGFVDSANAMQATFLPAPAICVPPSVSPKELALTVVHYADKHRDELRYAAASMVILALAEAHPCPK